MRSTTKRQRAPPDSHLPPPSYSPSPTPCLSLRSASISRSFPIMLFNPNSINERGWAAQAGSRSHLWSEAQQGGEQARQVVDGDVPEQHGELGCVPQQVPQHSYSQLHGGGWVLGLRATTARAANVALAWRRGTQAQRHWAGRNRTVRISPSPSCEEGVRHTETDLSARKDPCLPVSSKSIRGAGNLGKYK